MKNEETIIVSKVEWDALNEKVRQLESKKKKTAKKPGKSNTHISDEFKGHLKILFDKVPSAEYVVVSYASRSWDIPCDIDIDRVFLYEPNMKQLEDLTEATDDDFCDEWYETFEKFVNKEIKGLTYTHPSVQSLDPGDNIALAINNKFKFEELSDIEFYIGL